MKRIQMIMFLMIKIMKHLLKGRRRENFGAINISIKNKN